MTFWTTYPQCVVSQRRRIINDRFKWRTRWHSGYYLLIVQTRVSLQLVVWDRFSCSVHSRKTWIQLDGETFESKSSTCHRAIRLRLTHSQSVINKLFAVTSFSHQHCSVNKIDTPRVPDSFSRKSDRKVARPNIFSIQSSLSLFNWNDSKCEWDRRNQKVKTQQPQPITAI